MSEDIKKVIICGLGAIGTAIGEKILDVAPDKLYALVDRERFDRYSKSPRKFNGKILDFNYILPEDTSIKADLVIIAVKQQNLEEVILNLKNFITEKTTIISLLNGVTSEETIGKTYSPSQISQLTTLEAVPLDTIMKSNMADVQQLFSVQKTKKHCLE